MDKNNLSENLILKEEIVANDLRKEMFSLKPGTEIVELTPENVSKAIAIIQLDANYAKAADVNIKPSKSEGEWEKDKNRNLGGSSAFWFLELKKFLFDKGSSEYTIETIICNCVNAVDAENSTRITSDGVGREQETEKILDYFRGGKLLEELKCPNFSENGLINVLSKKTKPKNEDKYTPRANLSFSSKFCQLACYWLFKGQAWQDNFSKYDDVVRNVLCLGVYKKIDVRELNIDKCKKTNGGYGQLYKNYMDLIDEIREGKISRHGFDQLVWFYYKGKSKKYLKSIIK